MSLVEGPINFNALAVRAGAGALLVLPVIAGLFARQAVAQTYPNSLIRIIVPYAAGGVTDSLARIIGAPVAEAVGQPVIVENRPGASSMLGMQACAKLRAGDAAGLDQRLTGRKRQDAVQQLQRVDRLCESQSRQAQLGHLGSRNAARSLSSLGLFASRGQNSGDPLQRGGAAQANPAVYSGEADITYMGFGTAAPQIAAGAIKPLVAVGAKRSVFMPELPSLGEEGGDPGLQGYFGLFAPAGTPQPIVQRLNAEFTKALSTPQVQAFYKNSTLVAQANTPDEFATFAKADREAAAKVFRSMGITPQSVPQ